MTSSPDDLEKLLLEVGKTISDNKAFMEKLMDEETDTSADEVDSTVAEEEGVEEL